MTFEVPKVSYTGKIREIPLGREGNTVIVGGESCYPFHLFEGEMPHPPKIAMEVYDSEPEDWPDTAL
jgi:acetyl-CoA decarbonylase/synthase complex subunit delta